MKVTQLTLASFAIFYAIHLFAKPLPKTMSKEWQEASNEYALVRLSFVTKWFLIWFLLSFFSRPIGNILTVCFPYNSARR
jgi:hypothetical protein